MAKSTRKSKKTQVSRQEMEEAAEIASQEAVDELGLDASEDEGPGSPFAASPLAEPDESYAEDDVFEESFKKAVALNTAPKFYIKKNSQFLAVKGWPYSWEKLQAEYGEGYYQVIAKAQNNGRILKKQSEMVGDPSGGVDNSADESPESPTDGNMAYLAMMNQFQERADAKAQAQAKAGENAMASVMQTVMQSQQQSTQLMIQMMQESNKQFQSLLLAMQNQHSNKGPDPLLGLVTTLLTQKPSDGFTTAGVLKMIQDAEARAEARANKIQEQIEKKADSLAEIKLQAMEAGEGDAEESGFKGLIKGFVPVLTQMMANQQGNPNQAAHLQEQQRHLMNPSQHELDEQAIRPMVPAPNVSRRPAAQPRPGSPAQSAAQPRPPGGVNPQNSSKAKVHKVESVSQTQELVLTDRQKREIFDAVAGDIGRALMDGVPASKTAQLIVDKLEKEGLSRQTVAKAYTLEDFYGYAREYQLPDEVKSWLKDFHESLQEMASGVVVREPTDARAPEKLVNGADGSAQPRPVSAKRAAPTGPRTGTQPGEHPKDL